jgi:hypothetical protein
MDFTGTADEIDKAALFPRLGRFEYVTGIDLFVDGRTAQVERNISADGRLAGGDAFKQSIVVNDPLRFGWEDDVVY